MDELSLKTFALGELYANCYCVYSQDSKKAILIDAPAPLDEVWQFARSKGLNIEYVLLTHGHFDHIAGLADVKVPVYVHELDAPLLLDARCNGSAFFSQPIVVRNKPLKLSEDTKLIFAARSIAILHTPGHTPGSVSIGIGQWLFTGDTLFLDSVGRTDIPLGSHQALIDSIKNKILVLSDDVIVYPGHGPKTSVGKEKRNNPYLK